MIPDESPSSRRRFLQAGAAGLGAASLVEAGRSLSATEAAMGESRWELSIAGTGPVDPRLDPFDRMLAAFLLLNEVPGAALAIARDGRLVYARGMGLADRSTGQRVEPQSLFRIASISKPVTAVTILQLAQQGRLKLDDPVRSFLKLEPFLPEGAVVDERWNQVTLRHLLRHQGGWDREKSFDPMFRSVEIARDLNVPPPAQAGQIIRYMLGRPLDFAPGEQTSYSNFGYCLLGRVIEQVTGQRYDEAVRAQIWDPLSLHRPRLGRTLAADRAAGEVTYSVRKDRTGPAVVGEVGQPVPLPYGAWALEPMDSHGGWIASAIDLVRFGAALDATAPLPLLGEEFRQAIWERPAGSPDTSTGDQPPTPYEGCGWRVVPLRSGGRNIFHTGSLDGTAALLVCRHDHLVWSVLFNTRSTSSGEHLARAIDPYLHVAADAVTEWPVDDLFPRFL